MFYQRFILFLGILAIFGEAIGQEAIFRHDRMLRPAYGYNGAIATAEHHATEAGLAVLKEGGNAADAAVCSAFTLAVTYPRAGNLGGGGFLLFHHAESDKTYALDFREVAPASATTDMFLDTEGNADPHLSRESPFAVGVPGSVAGLLEFHQRFGTLPLDRLLMPAIQLARDGFIIDRHRQLEFELADQLNRLGAAAKSVYFGEDGIPPVPGERLLQPELADTLERIANDGAAGFYAGVTAQAVVDTITGLGGSMSMQDLADYRPVWRIPLRGEYRGNTVLSMPPPSSGGVHILQMLNLLENFQLAESEPNSAETVHLLAEVMKRAYADRSKHLGDPDFYPVPVEQLLSEAYEKSVLDTILTDRATPSALIEPGELANMGKSDETTHLSVVDPAGNAVSLTTTLNFSFGCGIVAEGAGFLLNNEMDDFSAKPGVPNAYGLVGGLANAIEPGKRPLSSMSPTILLRNEDVFLVTGSPGGSRIITTVLQMIVNVIDFDFNILEATYSPRLHHQWLPDVLYLENGFSADTRNLLESMGHTIEASKVIGSAQSIMRDEKGRLSATADPRRTGTARIF